MLKTFQNLSGKRSTAVLIDGKLLQDKRMEIQEHQHSHVITNDLSLAKELFKIDTVHVVQGTNEELNISPNWAAYTVCAPLNAEEFSYYAQKVSDLSGFIIYSIDFLDVSNEREMHTHFDNCDGLYNLIHTNLVEENGHRYLIARRQNASLLTHRSFDDFKALFYGPIVDSTKIAVKVKGDFSHWSHPMFFKEDEIPQWKNDFFFEAQSISDDFFDDIVKPKFIGSTAEVPNHEQIAILLASGAIDKEVTLADGRIVILKGTEVISTKEKTLYDLEGEEKAFVEQQVRNTLIYELDMTNGLFSKLGAV